MKRLVRYPVYASETIEAGMLETAAKLLKTLFRNLDNTFDTISNWVTADDEAKGDEAKGNSTDSNNAKTAKKDHGVIEIMPVNDDEEWETGPSYRVLYKFMDADKDYITIRFDMKSKNGKETDSDAATLKKQDAKESNEDVDARIANMFETMCTKLLERCSDGKFTEIADFREVS